MTYAEAIQDILKNAISAKTRLMEAFMADPNHTLSVEEITRLLHYGHPVGANGIVGQIGAQVSKRTGQPHPDGYAPGTFQPQSFITTRGKSRDSSYAFQLRPHIVKALHELNLGGAPIPILLPEELSPHSKELFREGAMFSVWVTAYERNAQARLKCLAHYGYECICCGLNMKKHYDLAEDFVHVHHLKPLASIGKSYELDPIVDLRPVCPNCHAVIHLSEPPRSIEEIRNIVNFCSNQPAAPPAQGIADLTPHAACSWLPLAGLYSASQSRGGRTRHLDRPEPPR